MTAPPSAALLSVVAEVEGHLAEAGWDQPPQLFALVDTEQLLRAEPQLAQTMGIVNPRPGHLTPVAQDPLADGPLDEALAQVMFGTEVLGVVLAHEVLVLPPSAEQALEDQDPATVAATHPERREVRMAVGVLRDGSRECVLRLRGQRPHQDGVPDGGPDDGPGELPDGGPDGGPQDELVSGGDLAPGLADALMATLDEG